MAPKRASKLGAKEEAAGKAEAKRKPSKTAKDKEDLGATLKLTEEEEAEEEEEDEEEKQWRAEWEELSVLRAARSEPSLPKLQLPSEDREYLRDHRPMSQPSSLQDVFPFRKGIKELWHLLDEQVAFQEDEKCKQREARRGKARVLAQRERIIKDGLQNVKPAWNYTDAPQSFNRATYIDEEQDRSMDRRLMKMLRKKENVDPNMSAPRVQTAPAKMIRSTKWQRPEWVPHATNEQNEQLAEFGTKARKRMSPAEKMYADRLDNTLRTTKDQEREEALFRTMGTAKKKHLEETAPEHSVLNPSRRMWRDQMVSTMAYFSSPDPYMPGENGFDPDVMAYVQQPWRSMDFSLDIVAGDAERTQHWVQPDYTIRGTNRKLIEAQRLARSCWNRTKVEAMHSTGKRLEEDDAQSLLEEFAMAMMYKYPNAEKAFKIFDINRNGSLSLSEFAQYAKTFFTGDVTSVYKALDVKKKGELFVEDFELLQKLEDAARQKALQEREQRRQAAKEKFLMARQKSAKLQRAETAATN